MESFKKISTWGYEETIYKCSICGKTSVGLWMVEICEKQCKCSHSDGTYTETQNMGTWPDYEPVYYIKCKTCNKTLGKMF